MIDIKNITKYYETFTALDNISATIEDGSVFALVGVNGSGKSTLLRLLAGVFKHDKGTILYDREMIYDNINIKKQTLFISDNPYSSTFTNISSLKTYYSSFYSYSEEVLNKYLDIFEVNLTKPLVKFSKGMARRVYLSFALAIAPNILLLDEAFDGLDPYGKMIFKKLLVESLEINPHMIVVLATQSLRDIEDIADAYMVLSKGKISEYGTIGELNNNYGHYLMAFKEEFDPLLFGKKYVLKVTGNKKIFDVYTTGGKKEVEQYLNSFSPLILEEKELTLEQLFVVKEEFNRE